MAFAVVLLNMITWYVVALSVIRNLKVETILNTIGSYGMVIYIVGYYIQNGIYVLLGKILGVPYLVYAQFICICGLIVPIFISKFGVKRFKITRFLVLGESIK